MAERRGLIRPTGTLEADPSSSTAPWRPVLLGVVATVLAVSAAMFTPGGRSNPAWHLAAEVAAVIMAGLLGALALVRFYAHRQWTFLLIGTGFLATAVLDAAHALVSGALLEGVVGPLAADRVAWSWLQARVVLAAFLAVSAFAPADAERKVRDVARIYVWSAVVTAGILVGFAVLPVVSTIVPGRFVARPAELVPGLLFGLALVGYLRRDRWRSDTFEFWLVVALVVAAVGHLAFMSRSVALLDPYADGAHLLKLVSYSAVACGLLASVHATFRREAEALGAGARANRALAREVDVRREAEAVLQRSEERLQNFLDSAHDLIQSTDPEGAIVYVNRAWERTLGYDRAEMAGVQLGTLLHPRCRRRVLTQFGRVLRGEQVDEILAEFISKDGRLVVCAGRATRHVVDGIPVATQSIFRDVTAQRAAERELAASRANVQALVENTGDMIWSVDTRHRLVTFNSAFALATEARWGREPQVGDTPDDVFGREDADWYAELYAKVLRGQRFSALREESVVGQTRAFEIFCNPVNEGAGATGAVMFGRDVTRRLQAEEAIRVARDEAEAANRAKSQFLANMSHELRTPLNSVIGFANILLKNKRGTLDEKDLGFLERILVNGRHLLALINEVLDLAKIEAGRMELDIEEIDLAHLVNETLGQLEGQAREKHVTLHLALSEPRPPRVETDSAKLKQVLINLVGNAVKFSEGGTVTVRLETGADGTVTGIAVDDTGVGIPPERLRAIFDAFAQADQTTSRRFGGTGLGLTISRSICQLLGYDLEVESTVGEGSTFTIRMPEARRAAPPEPPSMAAAAAMDALPDPSDGHPAAQERRVLVVDDEHDARLVLSHYLREMGCTVLTAGTGREALEIARRERPDLVTLDLRMPDLHGAEILRRLKSDPDTREIPVVVVSVDAHEGRGRLVGALDLLPKPVERDDLLRVVWRVLMRRGTTRVLVVQEDADGRDRLVAALADVGLEVQGVSGLDAVTLVLATDAPDAVVLDLGDPDGDGFPVLASLREHPYHGGLPVVVLTDRELDPAEREELDEKASSVLRRSDDLQRELVRTLGTFLPLSSPDPATTPAEASAGSPSP